MNKSALLTIIRVFVSGGAIIGAFIWVNLSTQAANPEGIREYNGQKLNSMSALNL